MARTFNLLSETGQNIPFLAIIVWGSPVRLLNPVYTVPFREHICPVRDTFSSFCLYEHFYLGFSPTYNFVRPPNSSNAPLLFPPFLIPLFTLPIIPLALGPFIFTCINLRLYLHLAILILRSLSLFELTNCSDKGRY